MSPLRRVGRVLAAPAFSPLGLLLWAARLAGLLLVLQGLGGREATSVLSGTIGPGPQMFLGLAYTLSYFACAAFTVPLLLAAGVTALLSRGFGIGPRADVC